MRPAWTSGIILTGIVVAAFNLRPGVTGLSPLLETMGGEIRLGGTFLAVIGMLPPLLYGLCGFLAPRLITRFSAMTMTVAAMAMITLGLGVRALVSDPGLFLALSVLALAGMGLGNVVVPPNVKHWHGAKVDSWFSHVAFILPGIEQSNVWLEPVDDEQYARLEG